MKRLSSKQSGARSKEQGASSRLVGTGRERAQEGLELGIKQHGPIQQVTTPKQLSSDARRSPKRLGDHTARLENSNCTVCGQDRGAGMCVSCKAQTAQTLSLTCNDRIWRWSRFCLTHKEQSNSEQAGSDNEAETKNEKRAASRRAIAGRSTATFYPASERASGTQEKQGEQATDSSARTESQRKTGETGAARWAGSTVVRLMAGTSADRSKEAPAVVFLRAGVWACEAKPAVAGSWRCLSSTTRRLSLGKDGDESARAQPSLQQREPKGIRKVLPSLDSA
ncbi:hypothetical protein NUW58_g7912 [Xylaria curta]|uniref:Uncharacterized protein n=1 Tax=Xylaria curta TaxID=42375 RepID=A0ACC1NE76_9PEZI|nr:hypothetical protein NUW58_g7912 [Xylaria curta]